MDWIKPQKAHRGKDNSGHFALTLLDDVSYVGEWKEDGERVQVHVEEHRTTRVLSSLGNEMSGPGLDWLWQRQWTIKSVVLDGEICSPGATSSDIAHSIASGAPVAFAVFDVLTVGTESIQKWPWYARRAIVDSCAAGEGCPQIRATMATKGKHALFEEVCAAGGEGIVMKRYDSFYTPGSRCRDWVKLHNPKRRKLYSVVITGVTDKATYSRNPFKTGECCHTYGVYVEGVLKTVGQLGFTGPCEVLKQDIGKVAEVEAWFQFRKTGALRHPQFIRFRPEYEQTECTNTQ